MNRKQKLANSLARCTDLEQAWYWHFQDVLPTNEAIINFLESRPYKRKANRIKRWKIMTEGCYAISNYGEMILTANTNRFRAGRLIKFRPLKNKVKTGYMGTVLTVHRKMYFLHKVVMKYFGPPKPESLPLGDRITINHKNLVKADCYIWNLEWMTMLDNINHARTRGACKSQSLTPTLKYRIRSLFKRGVAIRKISRLMNVSIQSVRRHGRDAI